jgi:hypothetical protein
VDAGEAPLGFDTVYEGANWEVVIRAKLSEDVDLPILDRQHLAVASFRRRIPKMYR